MGVDHVSPRSADRCKKMESRRYHDRSDEVEPVIIRSIEDDGAVLQLRVEGHCCNQEKRWEAGGKSFAATRIVGDSGFAAEAMLGSSCGSEFGVAFTLGEPEGAGGLRGEVARAAIGVGRSGLLGAPFARLAGPGAQVADCPHGQVEAPRLPT